MRFLRVLLILFGLGLLTYAGLALQDRATFDRAAWQQDFAQLLDHTSRSYANLEWVAARGVSLPQLKEQTLTRLTEARSDREARAALTAFAEAFGDPHYRVHRVKLSKRVEAWWRSLRHPDEEKEIASPGPELGGEALCTRLGFATRGQDSQFEFSVQGAQWLEGGLPHDEEFPTAALRLRSGKTVGLVRIGSFSERSYPRTCQAAWESYRATLSGPCDQACQETFQYVTVPNALLAAVERRVEQLRAQGVDALAVDLTGNGGGTDWAAAAARIFAPAPLPCGKLAVVKHPHWTEHFRAQKRELHQALQAMPDAAVLTQAVQRLDALIAETSTPCDRLPLWERGGKVDCQGTTRAERSACGLFAHLPPGSLEQVEVAQNLEHTLAFTYRPALWTGPLILVLDDHTASASEQFAAMLLDGAKAIPVGERTLGAGCGFTRGGIPARLNNSGLEVWMPDCARLRADGSNEIDGITPSVALTWADTAPARAEQLATALQQALGGS